jgi:hypothetical protein
VDLEARVTLRARAGRLHLAQTQAHCRVVDAFAPAEPGRIAAQCLEQLGRDLAGWLEGVSP